MTEGYEIHVISNTHWDREWLSDFQETRLMLAEFFDTLLDILDNEPDYAAFLLDAQVAPVDDYLEIRPQNTHRVCKHVADGRLHIGPWYTGPDCFLAGGESLVRNLLYGHRTARAYGGVMKVGHTPFSYGQNSQMPQIYRGFGIDTILFYHGVTKEEVPNEFIFEGADGSRVLASQMSSGARYNFYHNVYRGVLYGASIDDREYKWTQGGLPFHLCAPAHCMEQHLLLDPVKHFFKERIKDSVVALREAETARATTRYLAFMQGHDSSVPDGATLEIIEEARKHLPNDEIFHSSLPALMEKVKEAAGGLTVLEGERRTPDLCDVRVHLYSDVTSSRTRMKRRNAQAEHALQCLAEPFAVVASLLGAPYPDTELNLAWRTLLRCHAHDSIAGSGVDEIERDMHDRLRQVINISAGLKRRALGHIQSRIDTSSADADDVLLTVYNPSLFPRTETVTAVVDLPAASGYGDVSIAEFGEDTPEAVQLVSRKPHHAVVNHPGDATAMMTCDRVELRFQARELPPLGYATYRLMRDRVVNHDTLVTAHNTMENEHLAVHIHPDGTLRLTHKASGCAFDGLHYFEDAGEAGHAWMHIEPAHDRVITTQGDAARVSLEESGPLLARYRIEHRMTIPAGLDENGGDPWKRLDGAPSPCKRTEETSGLVIVSEVTLCKDAQRLDIVTRFDNRAHNHRLRAVFPTGLAEPVCHAESAFDLIERPIEFGPESPWHKRHIDPAFPMQRLVDVTGKQGRLQAGLSVLNDGLREYQVTRQRDRAIAITLMRAYEVSLTTVSKRWDIHPEMELSQCPGEHEFRYALYPHGGTADESGGLNEAECLNVPVQPVQAGAHQGGLPSRKGFLWVQPSRLAVTALKWSEDGEGVVVRVFNPSAKPAKASLTAGVKLAGAALVTLEEELVELLKVKGTSVDFAVGRKQICSVKLTF